MPEEQLAAPERPHSPPHPGAGKRRIRVKWVVYGVLLLAGLFVLAEGLRVLVGRNFHTVLPGRVYRCAQPSPEALEEMVAAHGIRTVVNLRGRCDPFPWYLAEARATARLDLGQEDVCLSAGRLPSAVELRRLVEVFDRAEPPLVLHCRRGADRTGLASAVALLLEPGVPLDEACRQLGPRYGHIRVGRTTYLDDFLALYRQWLAGREHRAALFRHWLLREYTAGACRAELKRVSPAPLVARAGEPSALTIRARNLGVKPWQFRPTANAGFHVGLHVWDETDRQLHMVRSGLRDATVAPGESMDLVVVIPALERPGRYRLMVDLVDEQQCWFFQTGSEPLEEELQVRE
jgi:hypothetical protein